jgi:hypothetical protein
VALKEISLLQTKLAESPNRHDKSPINEFTVKTIVAISMKESDIHKSILDWLAYHRILAFKHRNVGIMKPNGSYIPLPAQERGISDILGCLPDGRFLAIEVKAPKGKPTEE